MEAFKSRDAFRRCVQHVQRSRILRLRSISTSTAFTNPTPSQAAPPPPNKNDGNVKDSAVKTAAPSPALLTLQPQTLHLLTSTVPPTPAQQAYTSHFFASPPTHLWTGAYFRQFPSSPHPEVCFLGRSNVGKSSLLNAIFNRTRTRTAHVSKKPGRTRTMNAFGVGGEQLDIAKDTDRWKSMGRGGVVVVDMPGYGKGSREEWGREIMKYLTGRKQLRRTFLLVDAEHGPKTSDLQLLQHLREHGVQHQVLLSKVDKILFPYARQPSPETLSRNLAVLRGICEGIQDRIVGMDEEAGGRGKFGGKTEILCCSAEKEIQAVGVPRGKLGIDAVRWAVLRACGLDCDEKGLKRQYETFSAMEEGGS
ncbi:hypothetical protein MBLNU459_g4127t1 [Dothideomycetes sp. NU459]